MTEFLQWVTSQVTRLNCLNMQWIGRGAPYFLLNKQWNLCVVNFSFVLTWVVQKQLQLTPILFGHSLRKILFCTCSDFWCELPRLSPNLTDRGQTFPQGGSHFTHGPQTWGLPGLPLLWPTVQVWGFPLALRFW